MYPDQFDRYVLLERLIEHVRAEVRQGALAKKAGVSQGTVSILENLSARLQQSAGRTRDPRQLVSRALLLQVLVVGLQLPIERVSALLWLFDATPLREDEEVKYRAAFAEERPHGGPESKPSNGTHVSYETILLDMLREAASGPTAHKADVEVVFRSGEDSIVEGEKFLLNIEARPGQRMLAIRYPSVLVLGQNILEKMPSFHPSLRSQRALETQKSMVLARERVHDATVRRYGERVVHSKRNLEAYLTTANDTPRSLRERGQQIARYIEWLRNPSYHFSVGLAEETSSLDMWIKHGSATILRGSPVGAKVGRRDGQESSTDSWGPRWIVWHDRRSVLAFQWEFENNWWKIPDRDRNRHEVAAQLESLLKTRRFPTTKPRR